MSDIKKQLYAEFDLKVRIASEGLNLNDEIYKTLDVGGKYKEQIHALFSNDLHAQKNLPTGLVLQSGILANYKKNVNSKLSLEYHEGGYYILEKEKELAKVDFQKRPEYYNRKTTDGVDLKTLVQLSPELGCASVVYSNECSLKEKGQDCLFCNANATKDHYAESEGIGWKYPNQIGEAVAAAYKEGGRHLTVTGGFVPERREVDIYLDIAESIQKHTGLEDFNGTAVIGAPADISVIDKYKEAGYRTLAINLEVWNKDFFKAICPGKEQQQGGYDHWIKALEYAVQVFGWGRVRSNFVSGIEPKAYTIQGLETLAGKGIVATTSLWRANPGSAFEGHRAPSLDWYMDLAHKNIDILRKNGITYEHLYDATFMASSYLHDIYKIEDELFPIFN